MTATLFNTSVVNQIRDSSLKTAGILVLQSPNPPNGYSTDDPSPQSYLDINNSSYIWNPPGNSMYSQAYPFAIVALSSADESNYILQLAQDNEASVNRSAFVAEAVEFRYRMYADGSSMQCLNDATCIPVGGYSVWASFGDPNSTRPIVAGIAMSDSTAMFHDMAYGVDSDTSGVVVLLAAAQALSTVPGVTNLEKQIVLALFTGECWGFVGSRNFVQDITNFTCNVYATASDGSTYCKEPYEPYLDFTYLNITRWSRILEVNQVGINSTLFMHRQHGENNGTDEFIADILATATEIRGLRVRPAANDTPGIPPASSQAFLAEVPTIPTIVLTDHFREYANTYYHSIYDNIQPSSTSLCDKATLVARVLLRSAGASNETVDSTYADCNLVQTLLYCLTQNFGCDFVQQYVPSTPENPPQPVSHYTSVYQLSLRKFIDGESKFYYEYLYALSANASALAPNSTTEFSPTALAAQIAMKSKIEPDIAKLNDVLSFADAQIVPPTPVSVDPGSENDDMVVHFDPKATKPVPDATLQQSSEPAPGYAFYHDAVDPALVFNYDTGMWTWGDLNNTMLWTESNWDVSIGTTSYRMEDPSVEKFMVIAGVLAIVATAVITYLLTRLCEIHLKNL